MAGRIGWAQQQNGIMKNIALIGLAILAAAWTAAAQETGRDGIIAVNIIVNALIPNASPTTNGATGTELPEKATPTNGLFLNFHEVPLNAVLYYLSAKAGLIIMSDVDLVGKVTVVAEQPVATNEIVDLLSAQLARNNYAVALNGRTLTIMDAARAKTSALSPVIANNSGPKQIPLNDQIVTEILPIHSLPPAQLVKDLESLIPAGDIVTANDAAKAIVMTASQKDIHRISEIIAALDSTAISDVQVYMLRYADAKSLASELKDIFQSGDASTASQSAGNGFGGPGGPGGGLPLGFPGGGAGEESTKNAQGRAIFVSDDQINAIVASVPPDAVLTVSNLIANLDKPSQGISEIRVLRLQHADPGEVVDELSNLFPSSNGDTSQINLSMGFQIGSLQQSSSGNPGQSSHRQRQTTVLVVPDRRTQSIIVTASKDMMEQVKSIVQDLDRGGQGVQKLTALNFGGADAATVQETMSGLFSGANSRGTTSTLAATPLGNRYSGNANSQSTTSSTTASVGSGSSGGSGPH